MIQLTEADVLEFYARLSDAGQRATDTNTDLGIAQPAVDTGDRKTALARVIAASVRNDSLGTALAKMQGWMDAIKARPAIYGTVQIGTGTVSAAGGAGGGESWSDWRGGIAASALSGEDWCFAVDVMSSRGPFFWQDKIGGDEATIKNGLERSQQEARATYSQANYVAADGALVQAARAAGVPV